jgi:hypothetical protein
MDVMDPADRTNAIRGPRLALTRSQSHAVQRRCDMLVAPATGHALNDRQCVVGGAAAVLTCFGLLDPKLRVLTALPVNDKHDFTGCLIDVSDDVLD